MSTRVTLTLAVLLALLGGYIGLVDRPMAQRAEQAKHLVQLDKAQVTMLSLVSAKGTVELARRDATHWEITAPFHAPAGSFTVGDLLDTLTGLVPQATVGGGAANLAQYGLDKPMAKVTLGASGGRSMTLEVGKPSPVGTGVYGRLLPGGSIYLLDSSIKDTLTKSAADLRQRTLADFASADAQKVRIQSPTRTLVVDRLEPDRWRIEGARPWPADDFKVTDLFFPLTTTDAKVFHDGVQDLAPYHLDHPTVTVELTLKGQSEPLRILLSRQGKVTYGTVEGSHIVLELDPTVLDRYEADPLSLVSHRILPYNAQDLTSFEWRRGGQNLGIRRQGPAFTGGGLGDKEISDMFSSLNLLDADKVEPLAAPPAGAPLFEIQTDGAPDARFLIKFYRQGQGWLVTDEGLGLQYRLTSNALDGLPQPIKAFLGLAQPGATTPKPKTAPPSATPSPGGPAPAQRPSPTGPSTAPSKP